MYECMYVCNMLDSPQAKNKFFEGQILPYFSWPTYIEVLVAYKNIILPSILRISNIDKIVKDPN